jgi:hypothetical protein
MKVAIKRGLLGLGYNLTIEGHNVLVRVGRVN